MSNDNIKVAYCVNHDPNAIASHYANHKDVVHAIEDIRVLAMMKIKLLVKKLRAEYPDCLIHLWASLECTNHSNAKGGLPRDQDSRTLANDLFRYIEAINPNTIWIENVREFMIWGPLDSKGKPIPELKAIDYRKWRDTIKSRYGYNYEHQLLNAADYGAYTNRVRYFAQFTKWGEPKPVWAKPTHSRDGKNGLRKHKPVKDILDFSNLGRSIFDGKTGGKKYSDNTFKRVLNGSKKNYPEFLTSYYGNGNSHSLLVPCNTLTTKDRFAFHYVHYDYSSLTTSSVNKPMGVLTTVPKPRIVTWLFDHQFGNKGNSIYKPAPTIIARQDKKPLYVANALFKQVRDRSLLASDDLPHERLLKHYMQANNILDITIRPLTIPEMLVIQGFPKNYILKGTVADRKKFIGNAVECNQAKVLFDAVYNSLTLSK
jgi:DNA (cytosine-5)-methyltransferase 1